MCPSDAPRGPEALSPVWQGAERTVACHRADLEGVHVPNSLAAVEACLAAGAPRIEIDARFLKDGTLAVFHDPVLERETDGTGALADMGLDDIRGVSYRMAPGPAIALIHEVVDRVSRSSMVVHVDLKADQPLPAERADALADALRPIRDHCIIGTQSHWNLIPMAKRGYAVAFDTTQQWHYWPGRAPGSGLSPFHEGRHGLWDDAPLAHIAGVSDADYVEARLNDLHGLVPMAAEWMVDLHTLRHLRCLGVELGHVLRPRDIQLAAWTIDDRGRDTTRRRLVELFDLGAETVIANRAAVVAAYLSEES